MSPEERTYRADLIAAVVVLRGGEQPPNRDREWQAAGRFWRWPGGPAPLEQVRACYEVEVQHPRWDRLYLSLSELANHYGTFLRSGAANYRAAIARARKAARGEYDQARQARPLPRVVEPDHMSTDLERYRLRPPTAQTPAPPALAAQTT